MGDLHHIETPKSDAELAKEYRDRLIKVLSKACLILDEVRRDGLVCNFSITPDQSGRTRVQNFDIVKSML